MTELNSNLSRKRKDRPSDETWREDIARRAENTRTTHPGTTPPDAPSDQYDVSQGRVPTEADALMGPDQRG